MNKGSAVLTAEGMKRIHDHTVNRFRAAAFATALLAGTQVCWCADVYASTAPNGSVRYANQPLDESYVLIFSEPQTPAPTPALQATRTSTSTNRVGSAILRSTAKHGVDASLVQAVASVESRQNTAAVSAKGARGVMQLMPQTAKAYGVKDPRQLHNPEQNVEAGVKHLKTLLDHYDGNVALALAAYNAGSGAVEKHGDRIPPYRETMLYVPAVLVKSQADRP